MARLQGALAAYGLGAALIVAATLLSILLHDALAASGPALLFVPAVLVAAMFGGLVPGLAATAVALPLVWYFGTAADAQPPRWRRSSFLPCSGAP